MSIIEAIRKARHRVITTSNIEPDLVVCGVNAWKRLELEAALLGYEVPPRRQSKRVMFDDMTVIEHEHIPADAIAVTKSIDLGLPKVNNNKYCSTCNYTSHKTEYEAHRFDLDCPMCGISRLSEFYSVGSVTHRKILSGEIHQPPYALNAPELP